MALHELLTRPGGLAERLRAARQSAGLSSAQLASALAWGRPKVSKIERGNQLPSVSDIRDWAAATEMPTEDLNDLLTLRVTVDAEHQQYRHRLTGGGSATFQADMETLIRAATRIRNFEPWIVPGLLQTAGYAAYRMTENSRIWGFDPGDIDSASAARVRRADVLYEPGRSFEFVILELALQPIFAPPAVMLEQLDRLVIAAGLRNVNIRILHTAELPVPPMSSILLLDDDRAHIETFSSGLTVGPEEAEVHARIMDMLAAAAATEEQTRALILATAEEIRKLA